MKKLLLILFLSHTLYAQTTGAVSGKATDSDGQDWVNGTWGYEFYPNPAYPNLNSYYLDGIPLSTYYTAPVSGPLDTTANFTTSGIPRSDHITPVGSQWKFQICPRAAAQCGQFILPITASSTVLTSLITANIKAPRFEGLAGTWGYNDGEAIFTQPYGATYWNVIQLCQRYYDGTTWACNGSGGGGGGGGGGSSAIIDQVLLSCSGVTCTLASAPTAMISITKNGLNLTETGPLPDYTISGTTVTLQTAVLSTDVVYATYVIGGGLVGGYPGVNPDNLTPAGISVSGQVAASNYNGPIQEKHVYALRSIATKTAQMYLNKIGTSGYNPTQMYGVLLGDSTGGFHTDGIHCFLATSYGSAGYGGSAMGNNYAGEPCINPAVGFTPTLAGGAYVVDGTTYPADFTHSPTGYYWVIPVGGSLTTSSSFIYTNTRQLVMYVGAATGAHITVSAGSGSTWTPLSSCNNVVASPSVGGVCDQTITRATQQLQITNAGTQPVYVINFAQIDTTVNGTVIWNLARGGLDVPNFSSTPSALMTPWMNAYKADYITTEWKQNGSSNSSCYQSSIADPTFRPYGYWYNQMLSYFVAANPFVDVIALGDYEVVGASTCIKTFNDQVRQWTQNQTRPQTYVDLYNQVPSYADQIALGWLNVSDGVHQTAVGQAAESQLIAQYLGLKSWPIAAITQDVNNTNVSAVKVSFSPNPGVSPSNASCSSNNVGQNLVCGVTKAFDVVDPSGGALIQMETNNSGPQWSLNKIYLHHLTDLNSNAGPNMLGVGNSSWDGVWSNIGAGTPGDWYVNDIVVSDVAGNWYWTKVHGATGGSWTQSLAPSNGTIPVDATTPVAGKATCWKTTTTIGYCSTQPDATGSCTCN